MTLKRLLFPKPSKLKRIRKPLRRSVRPKARRTSERAKSYRFADSLWSIEVRDRAAVLCELSDCFQHASDAHHIFAKSIYPRLRHDLDNGIALCRKCHQEWHRSPVVHREWFARYHPETWRRLQEKAKREARLNG